MTPGHGAWAGDRSLVGAEDAGNSSGVMVGNRVKEPWRQLRVGDRIRLVQMPSDFARPGYFVHRDTLRVYRRLIDRRRSVRICRIDEFNMPWIHCQFRRKDGRIEYHYLLFNHDGWVRVKPRSPSPPTNT